MNSTVIAGIGSYVPENVVTNEELTQFMDTSDTWIQERTGIEERRYVTRFEQTTATIGAEAAKQAIWLQELLSETVGEESKRVVIKVDNRSAIALTKNPVFHGRSKHIHRRFHFIRECVDNGLIEVHHVAGVLQRADILTKPLARTKFKEMRELLGVKDVLKTDFKLKGENVGLSLG